MSFRFTLSQLAHCWIPDKYLDARLEFLHILSKAVTHLWQYWRRSVLLAIQRRRTIRTAFSYSHISFSCENAFLFYITAHFAAFSFIIANLVNLGIS